MTFTPTLTKLALATALGSSLLATQLPAVAGEGHDHGDAPAAASGPALPRFTATSDQFELVGVINGKDVTLYLDGFADNQPVRDARIELSLAGEKLEAQKHGEDTYEVTLAQAPNAGEWPVTAKVTVGALTSELKGDLDLHGAEEAHGEGDGHDHEESHAPNKLAWGAGAAVVLGLLALAGRRWWLHRRASPQPSHQARTGEAA
ncbi:hypothetical protein [Ideonella margarita]|uniref:Uncharacterized protein n=1 Tax=Ideonella margarita TaxID=2984191 RepID=A0ABU9C384_9BURK